MNSVRQILYAAKYDSNKATIEHPNITKEREMNFMIIYGNEWKIVVISHLNYRDADCNQAFNFS